MVDTDCPLCERQTHTHTYLFTETLTTYFQQIKLYMPV